MPPAWSICESTQPPKMSPLALVSAGIALVRTVRVPGGSAADTAFVSSMMASLLGPQQLQDYVYAVGSSASCVVERRVRISNFVFQARPGSSPAWAGTTLTPQDGSRS